MSVHFWHRSHRRAVLAGAAGAAVLAALTVATGATGCAATAQPSQSTAATGRAQVPWAEVGPGWELVQYSTGNATIPAKPAPVTLYLVGPSGARYSLYTWPASAAQPSLVDWSGDKTRALLRFPSGMVGQLTLATGKLSTFALTGQGSPLGYTRPSGLNILGWQQVGSTTRIVRYSLTGQLLKVLATGPSSDVGALYSADGTVLAVSSAKGLTLVSNEGAVIRSLPVGDASATGCQVVRWWDARTVLAACTTKNSAAARLWLVPVSGAMPTVLTPQRAPDSRDLGDLDAWRLPNGLYVEGAGACGTVQIYQQAASGSITQVLVPGATNVKNLVVTASGSRLLVQAETGCQGSDSLLWFNPATHAEQWLLRTPETQAGVLSVVAYYSRENAG